MKFKHFHIVAGSAMLLMYASATADSRQWSLRECIDYALVHNIRIKGQHLETSRYQNRFRQSKADLLPEINGYANQDFRFGRSIDPYTNGYKEQNVRSNGFLIDGRVTLFDGMRSVRTIRRNEIDLMASENEVEYLKNEITLHVVDAYLMTIYNREMIGTVDRQLEVTRLQIARTQVLVDAGSVSRGNLYELSALVAQEEVDLLRARNQQSIALMTLQQLLELDTLADFEIALPQLPEIRDTDLQAILPELYRSALSLPEVQRGALGIRSATLDLKIEKTKRLPTLMFDAAMGTGYSGAYKRYRTVFARTEEVDYPFAEQFRDNANTKLSLQFTVPLFNRLRTASAISDAEITIEQKMIEHEIVKKKVRREVQIAYYDARASLQEYHGTIRAVDAIRESFRYTEEKFNVGMVSPVDYHNGKNLLSKAESDLLQAKYKYFLKKSILEILCGTTVTIN